MQQATDEAVSFSVRRTACATHPISTLQNARKQVHAERVVCELLDPSPPEAIGFDYRVEAVGGEFGVVLTIFGSDELLVREVARRLDEHYHGQPFYEEMVDESRK